jgi:MFS family permease
MLFSLYCIEILVCSCVFAGYIVKRLGQHRNRLVMGFAASTYVLFIALHLYPTSAVLITSGVLLGLGVGLLWTAQGSHMSLHGTENRLVWVQVN